MFEAPKALWRVVVDLFRRRAPKPIREARVHPQPYQLVTFEDRSQALEAIKTPGTCALIDSDGKHKWALVACPCGCGEPLVLNLMRSHSPSWQLHARTKSSFTLHPSVHSMTCGAHFWLREGRVIWCD